MALIYNAGISFAFFFYNETVMGLRSAIAGFAPSTSSGRNGGSLTIPGVFTNTTDLTSGSNTDVPGSYAFRVDLSIIVQPGGIVMSTIAIHNVYYPYPYLRYHSKIGAEFILH